MSTEINPKELFSETDSSGDENESMIAKNLSTPSPQGAKDANNASTSFLSKSSSSVSSSSTGAKQDRRYLGSLRKLTKGGLPFKSSSNAEKKDKSSSDIPVPTEQYRSYRKVPGGSFGIQIGANTPGYGGEANSSFLLLQNSGGNNTRADETQSQGDLSNSRNSLSSRNIEVESISSASTSCLGPPSFPAPVPQPAIVTTSSIDESPTTSLDSTLKSPSANDSLQSSPTKSLKKIPFNFLHASNPNLVEFDFQTSKTLDYALPKINPTNAWDAPAPIQGFVTLKDLMLQKQEEEAQEMYNNRVLLGVEKKEEFKRQAQRRAQTDAKNAQNSSGANNAQSTKQNTQQNPTGKISKTQNRSLPKTPDYEISFKPDDENIKRTRTKEGLKLRDFGYELISGDEPLGGASANSSAASTLRQNSNSSTNSNDQHEHHNWRSRQILKAQQNILTSSKGKKHSSSSIGDAGSITESLKSTGSFKKKGKLEAFKNSSERLFQFNKHSGSSSGMTMTLPLNKHKSGSGIKKSHTYNNDLKEKADSVKYESQRKNSAPMFTKLLSSSSSSSTTAGGSMSGKDSITKGSKEKKLLGSPLLHRTLFGSQQHSQHHQNNANTSAYSREYDQEIFSQVILPHVPSHHHHPHHMNTTTAHYTAHHQHFSNNNNNNSSSSSNATHEFGFTKFRNVVSSNANITAPDVEAPPPPEREASARLNSNASSTVATPEYPNMECPPVFEPEIYSLNEPSASSLSLLLRKNNTGTTASSSQQQQSLNRDESN